MRHKVSGVPRSRANTRCIRRRGVEEEGMRLEAIRGRGTMGGEDLAVLPWPATAMACTRAMDHGRMTAIAVPLHLSNSAEDTAAEGMTRLPSPPSAVNLLLSSNNNNNTGTVTVLLPRTLTETTVDTNPRLSNRLRRWITIRRPREAEEVPLGTRRMEGTRDSMVRTVGGMLVLIRGRVGTVSRRGRSRRRLGEAMGRRIRRS